MLQNKNIIGYCFTDFNNNTISIRRQYKKITYNNSSKSYPIEELNPCFL